jgi:hypothetical protein
MGEVMISFFITLIISGDWGSAFVITASFDSGKRSACDERIFFFGPQANSKNARMFTQKNLIVDCVIVYL